MNLFLLIFKISYYITDINAVFYMFQMFLLVFLLFVILLMIMFTVVVKSIYFAFMTFGLDISF